MVYQALPPPPQIRRWTPDGLPTQAQVEYENRESIYKASVETYISESVTTVTNSVNQNSASITSLQSATASISGALGVSWAIQGNLNGATGGLIFTGIKKADGSGAVYNLEIYAGVTINGGLLVNGSITGQKIDAETITANKIVAGTIETTRLADGAVVNEKILNNAVSNSAFTRATNTPSSAASVTINLRAGARVTILATYEGGDNLTVNPTVGTLKARVNGNDFSNNSIPIRPTTNGVGFTTFPVNGVNCVTSVFQNYLSGPATLLTYYTAPSTGSFTVTGFADGAFNQGVNLLVLELSK